MRVPILALLTALCSETTMVAGAATECVMDEKTGTCETMTTDNEPNPPVWPDSVIIFYPQNDSQTIMDLVKPLQDNPIQYYELDNVTLSDGFGSEHHFIEDRYALLFAPDKYSVDIEVGYYVQVAGLGATPDEVEFTNTTYGPYVPALNKDQRTFHKWDGSIGVGSSLDTFWRAAENYKSNVPNGQLWAVSQASPLRRVQIEGNLNLVDGGAYASGGVLANAVVTGQVNFGGQQQFLTRSVKAGSWNLGAWSNVFVDCLNAPAPILGNAASDGQRSVTVDNPLVTVEKPFIALKKDLEQFELHVPQPRLRQQGADPLGPDLTGATDDIRDFTRVMVAVATTKDSSTGQDIPDGDVAKKINAALMAKKDIVLSPGMYYLKEPLNIQYSNQTILGLGLATLVAPVDGKPCIKVPSNLEGVRVAGIMLEASNIPKDRQFVASLLEWGDEGTTDPGNAANPSVITDVFARVGGSNLDRQVATDVMVRIHSGHVYGDNLWLWRADHVKLRPNEDPNFPPLDYHQTTLGEVPVKTGLEVNGDNVTIHGLAVEHTTEHLTVWTGEDGNVQFYQSELPYDVKPDYGFNMYTGYKVHPTVDRHTAGGVGVYSNFRDYVVPVPTAIHVPASKDGVKVTNAFAVRLDNYGYILSVMNGDGNPAKNQSVTVFA